jgi:hypothetical protein
MAYKKELPLFDIYQTSFLDLHGVPIRYEKRGTRVVFLVPNNDDTIRLLNQFQNNPTGGLLDFTAALRRVRAQMLGARDGKGNGDIYGRKTR